MLSFFSTVSRILSDALICGLIHFSLQFRIIVVHVLYNTVGKGHLQGPHCAVNYKMKVREMSCTVHYCCVCEMEDYG